ncbi:MAG: TonB-dependent receptor [Phocaeicola sp.]
MKNKLISILLFCLLGVITLHAQTVTYTIRGKVIDKQSRKAIPYINVVLEKNKSIGASTDSLGIFEVKKVPPGISRFIASSIGYKPTITAEYIISSKTPFIEVEIEEDNQALDEITVRPERSRYFVESPISLHTIGLKEIEKSPGSNRDISRIVRSYPGVAFSPAGYRNDLIIRGGGPAENRFYMDGIEIPNINHFATQGASGGPVSLINADLVREISFYTGAFPTNRSGAMSSVLDFNLRNGSLESQSLKATLGASEVSLSGSGHLSSKTTYLFSIRQSYLQLLFKTLGLPFLPNFIDGQFKLKWQLTPADELSVMAIAGFDKMKLNTDEKGEEAEYLLSYLPEINQETYTVGATYRHYGERGSQHLFVSHSYLNNRNLKYRNNDETSEENLTLRLRSTEQKSSLRGENWMNRGNWTFKQGVELNYIQYANDSYQRLFVNQTVTSQYQTALKFATWGFFGSANYTSPNNRYTASMGIRADGADYGSLRNPLKHLSPRFSSSYQLTDMWSLRGNIGIYYQLPPYTALGYKNNEELLINKELKYQQVTSGSIGTEFKPSAALALSVEAFYKYYRNIPLSIADQIPLACKGDDYGVTGNEPLTSTALGEAYGVELSAKWSIQSFSATSALTVYKSQYRANKESNYIASAWDNNFILNTSGVWELPKHWSIGGKLSFIGGAPYTPYDEEKSALVEAWDAQGRAYYDYSRYNTERLHNFMQLDMRVDKNFYFRKWRLGLYVDIQNILGSKLQTPDALISTGKIENPEAPISEQRYVMKKIKQEYGTILPTIGITVEF